MAVVLRTVIVSMSMADESSPFDMVAHVAFESTDDAEPIRHLAVRQAGEWYWRLSGTPVSGDLSVRLEARARVYEWDNA